MRSWGAVGFPWGHGNALRSILGETWGGFGEEEKTIKHNTNTKLNN